MPVGNTGETRLRLIVYISTFPCAYKLKIKFQFEEEGIGNIFCGILDHVAVQDCTKFPSVIANVLLQLVKDIINGVGYQRY